MKPVEPQLPLVDHRLQMLRRHWRRPQGLVALADHAAAPPPDLVIAVSREAGAPGAELGELLVRRLNWPVYDREILEAIAEQTGLRAELLESVDERDPHWLVETIQSFAAATPIHVAHYVQLLTRVVAALADKGSCIVIGRGATIFLPPDRAVRVRVVADLQDRILRSMKRFKLTKAEAAERVQRVDADRRRFVANHFHRDVSDPRNFDFVLNASRWNLESAVDIVVAALDARRRERTSAGETSPEPAAKSSR